MKGTLILYNNINPIIPVMITARVETSGLLSLIILGKVIIIIMFETMVKAVGKLFFNTFTIILPFILSLFGSKARINDGIPIVTVLISVSCIGING